MHHVFAYVWVGSAGGAGSPGAAKPTSDRAIVGPRRELKSTRCACGLATRREQVKHKSCDSACANAHARTGAHTHPRVAHVWRLVQRAGDAGAHGAARGPPQHAAHRALHLRQQVARVPAAIEARPAGREGQVLQGGVVECVCVWVCGGVVRRVGAAARTTVRLFKRDADCCSGSLARGAGQAVGTAEHRVSAVSTAGASSASGPDTRPLRRTGGSIKNMQNGCGASRGGTTLHLV